MFEEKPLTRIVRENLGTKLHHPFEEIRHIFEGIDPRTYEDPSLFAQSEDQALEDILERAGLKLTDLTKEDFKDLGTNLRAQKIGTMELLAMLDEYQRNYAAEIVKSMFGRKK